MLATLRTLLVVAAFLAAQRNGIARADETQAGLRFSADGAGGFRFDTGHLRGNLHAAEKSLGLTDVTHLPTGTRVDHGNGLLSHYRVFARGVRFGAGAWDWPSQTRLLDDGAAEVRWPAADRPFALRARYRLLDPDTIEVETTVDATGALPAFEIFLASYFAETFTNAVVRTGSTAAPIWIEATPDRGDWQMFSRDAVAREIAGDGRWRMEPNPVAWKFPADYGGSLAHAQRRSVVGGLTADLQAPAGDAFAVALPQEHDGHRSLYFSLFGRDLAAGSVTTVRTRLHIALTVVTDPVRPAEK